MPGHLHQAGRAGAVVVRPVVELALPGRPEQAARFAVPEVVVVRPDDDRFVRQRAAAFEDADDVPGRDLALGDRDFGRRLPALQGDRPRLQVLVDGLFDRGELLVLGGEHLFEDGPLHLDDRDGRRLAPGVAEVHERVALLGVAAVVDEQHAGGPGLGRDADLGGQRGVLRGVLLERVLLVLGPRRPPQQHDDLALHVEVGVLVEGDRLAVEVELVGPDAVADEHDLGRVGLAAAGEPGGAELLVVLDLVLDVVRAGHDQGVRAAEPRRAGDGERLEVALRAGRLQPGGFKAGGDVLAGLQDALRLHAPAFALVAGQEVDVLLEATDHGVRGDLRLDGHDDRR